MPEDPRLEGDTALSPSVSTKAYVNFAASFGDTVEVRTGWATQDLPIWLQMPDLSSSWSFDNGLKSLVSKLLQLNLNGYGFIMPSIIDGIQRSDSEKISKELFIRWLQATVFMPSLQFSVAPWDFDKETVRIGKMYTKIHEDYADLILERFHLASETGKPGFKEMVNRIKMKL